MFFFLFVPFPPQKDFGELEISSSEGFQRPDSEVRRRTETGSESGYFCSSEERKLSRAKTSPVSTLIFTFAPLTG